jgi:UDP-glucose 4-epimerase
MTEGPVLVTGASGFIGRHLVADLNRRGIQVRVAVRDPGAVNWPAGTEVRAIGDLRRPVDWHPLLKGIDGVVHAAGLAHAGGGGCEADYVAINTDATLRLAEAAVANRVRRFVYLSSIRAQSGASAEAELTERTPPAPTDIYGRSKLAAEQGLSAFDLDWVALRPVLVYGPGAKANMGALLRLAKLPLPLPLAGFNTPRSLLAIENLAGAVAFALSEACPPRQAYIVADPEIVTVAEIVTALRAGSGARPGLFRMPPRLMALVARLAGQEDTFERLSRGLVARPGALMTAGWRPTAATGAALGRLADDRDGA